MKPLKTFTIKRSKWARGGKNGGSSLLNREEGTMCCLGFFGKKNGATDEEIVGWGMPTTAVIYGAPKGAFPGIVRRNNDECMMTQVGEKCIEVNDRGDISDDVRESRLTKLFAKIGWKPRFINILIIGAMMAFAGVAQAQPVEKEPNKLQDALAEAVNRSVEVAGEAKDFLAAEIPEVVRQLLMWKMAESIAMNLFYLVLLALSVLIVKKQAPNLALETLPPPNRYWEYSTATIAKRGWPTFVVSAALTAAAFFAAISAITSVNLVWL